MTEFDQYEALKRDGSTPAEVYKDARRAGMGKIEAIRMLRAVFGLSLRGAKEAMIVGSGTAESLSAHEEAIARELEAELDELLAGELKEQGGEFFIPVSGADRYIDVCVEESQAIVGIETFRLEAEKHTPILDEIADFSSMLTATERWDVIVRKTAAEAHRFVRRLPTRSGLWLSFTLLSEQEQRLG